jgi:hypothetical protein
MKKALQKTKKKRRGRPAIGRNIALRLPDHWTDQIAGWAKEEGLTRSQVLRKLIEAGADKLYRRPKSE